MQKHVAAAGMGDPLAFLSRVSIQGRNYSMLVGWLLYRAFGGRSWKLVVATGLSLLHLGGQTAAIYVVYWYAKQMEKDGLVRVPLVHLDVNLKTQPEWLWAIVATSIFAFIISAVFLYLSRQQILSMVEGHYARGLEQLVLLSLRIPDPRVPVASRLFMDHGLGGLTTGCRRAALTAISFAGAITAAVGGLGAAFFLFRIDLTLTLLIFISAVLGALFLYPLTIRAVESAKGAEKARLVLRAEVRKLNDARTTEQTATSLASADSVARASLMRRRVLNELVFATEIGITILLGVVIYYMARQALSGREQWAIFIAYVGALRLTLSGAAQILRAVASVSRYYPPIVRYYLFVKNMKTIDSIPLAELRQGDTVILGTLPNGEDVVVEAGECLALLVTGPIREPTYCLIGAKLASSKEPVAAAVIEPAKFRKSDAGLVLISALKLGKDKQQTETLLTDTLKDKVTLIVSFDPEKVGSFGEKYVLTVDENGLRRFALLGTEEADAVLKESSLQIAAKRGIGAALDDDDDDEDEM